MAAEARTTALRLRRWQCDALAALAASSGRDFLAVATPGAGKTTFALAALLRAMAEVPGRQAVVVAPTRHLKVQWARAAAKVGLQLEPFWSSSDGLPSDMHGIVVTYQQVAANAPALAAHASRCVVVLDEIHHAGSEKAWGRALREAFDDAPVRMCLSGTPFRSDTHAIPFVRYVADLAEADFEYGYAAALADSHVVRPVYFPAFGGEMEWTAADGSRNAASFDDVLDEIGNAQRLRTALSLEGEWLPSVLARAHDQLREVRLTQHDAAGLVIASDQDHAKGIVRLLRERHGVAATLAVSDDRSASRRIAEFAEGRAPWLVAVRMVSEGVDIPRLRLGVYATTTTTELFFRQAVGRFVRHSGAPHGEEQAWLYIPDDHRLRHAAATIAEERRHSLRRVWEEGESRRDPVDRPEDFDAQPGTESQMSLFAPLSSSAASAPGAAVPPLAVLPVPVPVPDSTVLVELPAPPRPHHDTGIVLPVGLTRSERKAELRALNSDLARRLSNRLGLTPQAVNARLNEHVGIARVADGTLEQLTSRAAQAQRWL